MPPQAHIPLPLEQLFAQLKAAGFRMDTGRKLRLLQVFEQYATQHIGQFSASELAQRLAPFVATNAEEQRRFYLIFEQFWAECEKEAAEWSAEKTPFEPPPTTAAVPDVSIPSRRNYWKLLLAAAALLLFGIAAYFLFRPPAETPLPPPEFEKLLPDGRLREGQSHEFRNLSKNLHPDSSYWELRDAATGALERRDTAEHFRWTATDIGRDRSLFLHAGARGKDSLRIPVHCADAPALAPLKVPTSPLRTDTAYTFSLQTREKSISVRWIFERRDTVWGNIARYTFRENGPATVKCIVARDSLYCYSDTTLNYDIGNSKPLLAYAPLAYDISTPMRYRLYAWVWALPLLPLLFALWCFWRWWLARRRKPETADLAALAEQHPIHDKAPYFIPYLSQDDKIATPPDFFRMAELLRRREENEKRSWDIPASVRATINAGGFPTLLSRREQSPPAWLFLIERPTAFDQQGRLLERLGRFFQRQDAPLEVFYHNGDYRNFWNDAHPEGLHLDKIQQHYADRRLVLLGSGAGLLNVYDTRLPALLPETMQRLASWKKRLFLSVQPLSAWKDTEVLLHREMLLYPADTEGILAGLSALETLDEYEPGPYDRWEERLAARREEPNPRTVNWRDPEAIRAYFAHDPEAFTWLCALAVSVQPDFALTLAIGKRLGLACTHDRLLRLSRVPWLSRNEHDPELADALLKYLSPEQEREARLAVAETLEAVQEQVRGSYAEIDWKTNLSLHRFALDPENESHRQALRELLALGYFSPAQLRALDGFVDRRIALPVSTVAAYLAHRPRFTRHFWFGLLGVVLALGMWAYTFWMHTRLNTLKEQQSHETFIQQEQFVDSAQIWHNEAVRMALNMRGVKTYREWNNTYRDSARIADSLLLKAWEAQGSSLTLRLIDSSLYHFRFNQAAQVFNFSLQDEAQVALKYSKNQEKKGTSNKAPKPPVSRRLLKTQTVNAGQLFPSLAERDSAIAQFRYLYLNSGPNTLLRLNALHAYGIGTYYEYTEVDLEGSGISKTYMLKNNLLETAKSAYTTLLSDTDTLYFDTLRLHMPVNLETLLADIGQVEAPRLKLQLLVLDARTRLPVANASTYALPQWRKNTDARGRLAYEFPVQPASPEIDLRVQKADYETWTGKVRLYSATRSDTIWLVPILPDRDRDGIPDIDDECPDEAGPATTKGCPDRDRDGIADQYDNCPDQAGLASNNGCPPVNLTEKEPVVAVQDKDKDGTPDAEDECPDEAGPATTKGCPDRDRDGVADKYDQCPDQAGEAGSNGCPPIAQANKEIVWPVVENDKCQKILAQAQAAYLKGEYSVAIQKLDALAVCDLSIREAITTAKNAVINAIDAERFENGMVRIKGGTFTMGCTSEQQDCENDEKPTHRVTLSDFYMGKYEVTQRQWQEIMGSNPSNFKDCPDCPVERVSWDDIQTFLQKLNARYPGRNYRLPTEAEWEYAAREGGKAVLFGNGKNILDPAEANFDASAEYKKPYSVVGEYRGKTTPVGSFRPNALGLYDMAGNVEEWCSDWKGTYPSEAQTNPQGPSSGSYRVLRGGSWDSLPQNCRVANRNSLSPDNRNSDIGFRLSRTP